MKCLFIQKDMLYLQYQINCTMFNLKYSFNVIPCKGLQNHQLERALHGAGGFLFYIGFLSYLFPGLFITSLIQRGGQQQSSLFSVSAGNDLRMSTMRPNPYLSTGIDERRSEIRGFLQLFSQAN
jgi:hypothetical protein